MPASSEAEKPSVRVAFWRLAGEKAARERRQINVSIVVKETGLPKNAIYRAARGTLRELPLDLVKPLATYFGVGINDILEEAVEGDNTPIPDA